MSKHVVIIGGGIVGCSAAIYAAQKGHRVTLLDRVSEEHLNCSFGNAGMVTPSHLIPIASPGMVSLGLRMMGNPESPFYIKPRLSLDLMAWGLRFMRSCTPENVERAAPVLRDILMAGRACFQDLAARTDNEFGLVERGLFMMCKTPATLKHEEGLVALANRLGMPAQVFSAKETAEREPAMRLDILGSTYFPLDSHLTPWKLMPALRRLAREAGADLRWNTPITGWRRENSRVRAVETPAGPVEGDEFVIATGSWSPSLGRELGVKMPIQAGKGYSLTVPSPPSRPSSCWVLTEARVAVTPMGEGALRFAGTMEIAGMSEAINPARVRGIMKSVPTFLPDFTPKVFEGVLPWCGLRPVTPDGLPYLGRLPTFPNVTAAAGHAMLGLSMGPITGKLVAELVSDEKPSVDISALRPERFG
jgi:D-amino-acid dehydrogenase